jgi:hypothetical protein
MDQEIFIVIDDIIRPATPEEIAQFEQADTGADPIVPSTQGTDETPSTD